MEKASRCLICDSHSHTSMKCHDLYNTHVEGSKSDQDHDDDSLKRNVANSVGQGADCSSIVSLDIAQLGHLVRSH